MDVKQLLTVFLNHTHSGNYPDAKRLPATAFRFPTQATCIGLISSNGTHFLLGVDDDGAPTLAPVPFTNLLTSADGTVYALAADSDGALICGPANSTYRAVAFKSGLQLYDALGTPFVLFATNDGALAVADGSIAGDGLPVGAHVWMAGASAPFGFLVQDGAEYAKADYPALAAYLGGKYGVPSDADHFCVPDLVTDKRFIRAGASAAVGTMQADALKSHTHGIPSYDQVALDTPDATGFPKFLNNSDRQTGSQTPAGDTETRPINVTYLPCIKW